MSTLVWSCANEARGGEEWSMWSDGLSCVASTSCAACRSESWRGGRACAQHDPGGVAVVEPAVL
jgi:hypothetical protein